MPAACWQCESSPTSCSLDASGAAGSGCARASRAGRPSPAWARPVPGPEPAGVWLSAKGWTESGLAREQHARRGRIDADAPIVTYQRRPCVEPAPRSCPQGPNELHDEDAITVLPPGASTFVVSTSTARRASRSRLFADLCFCFANDQCSFFEKPAAHMLLSNKLVRAGLGAPVSNRNLAAPQCTSSAHDTRHGGPLYFQVKYVPLPNVNLTRRPLYVPVNS